MVFYIFTDLILISQFLYYKIKNSSTKSETTVLHSTSEESRNEWTIRVVAIALIPPGSVPVSVT